MLYQADQQADRISGMGVQWMEDFGDTTDVGELPSLLAAVQAVAGGRAR